MKKEKNKQLILILLSFVFIGIGVFNFSFGLKEDEKILEVSSREYENELNLGDVQLVNSDVVKEEISNDKGNNKFISEIVPNDEIENENNNNGEKSDNSNNIEDYFLETKLQRDVMYSEIIDTYQKMLSSAEVHENQKMIASQEIQNINNIKNAIMISENLIKNKGFENVVVLENNGILNIVVKSDKLSVEEIAQIQNIILRQFNTNIENINISNKE